MSGTVKIDESLRAQILSQPDVILEDHDLMRALIVANERTAGRNVVDLRGIAMERLEARLDRLEDTHRSVIAAAYENLAGTNQVHRALLHLMDVEDFEGFLKELGGEVAEILRVDTVRLVLETDKEDTDGVLKKVGDTLSLAPTGFIDTYISQGRGGHIRQVALRQLEGGDATIYGDDSGWIRSEACLKLDLGEGRMPGMVVMAAEDSHRFTPQHGTDLLAFFAGVVERAMRLWLA